MNINQYKNEGMIMSQGNWELKISEGVRRLCSGKSSREHCQIIIEFSGTDGRAVQSLIQSHQGRVVREVHLLSGIVAEVPMEAIQPLAKSNLVKKIWSDSQIKIC